MIMFMAMVFMISHRRLVKRMSLLQEKVRMFLIIEEWQTHLFHLAFSRAAGWQDLWSFGARVILLLETLEELGNGHSVVGRLEAAPVEKILMAGVVPCPLDNWNSHRYPFVARFAWAFASEGHSRDS
jgi:hypothetical protein